MKKMLMVVTILMLISGCATVEEKAQAKYGAPLKIISYDNDTYKVVVNEKMKGILVKENTSLAERAFSPKYGAIGLTLDAMDAFGMEEKYRIIADDYLSKTLPECKTVAGKIEKCNMECYEFEYVCNPIANKDVIEPYYLRNN